MHRLYPLRFQSLFKHAIWGGRRLKTALRKPIGPGDDYAESWEIADHGPDQSVVASGPLAGMTLHRLVAEHGAELLGRHHPQTRFPLLLKYLDANQRLSVQVHPDDALAADMHLEDCGKTEAWVILAADPNSSIWAGLQEPMDREVLRHAILAGTLEQHLHQFRPVAGQCVFLPARTIHALGDGVLVAEIQQTSDLTFRLYDWNRLGPDGQPRTLHIDEGLDAVDCNQGPVEPRPPMPTGAPHRERLVQCEKFVLDRWQFRSARNAGGDGRCHIFTVLQGAVHVENDPSGSILGIGQTVLLPASAGPTRLAPEGELQAVLLDAFLP